VIVSKLRINENELDPKDYNCCFSFFVILVAKSTNIDFLNSSILKKGEHTCAQQMFEWFGGNTWQLCYRASRDGWYAKDFHSKCDNKIPTIVLVKVVDYIFGGFTDTNWEQKKLKGMFNLTSNN
jgi:hypothetical protein